MRYDDSLRTLRLTPVLLGLLLSACGDDTSKDKEKTDAGDDPQNQDAGTEGQEDASPDDASLEGTAAFGAAVSGGQVQAKCEQGDTTYEGATDETGAFELAIPEGAYPCVLRVTGGNLPAGMSALHSWAAASGVANITPLTDIALALMVERAVGGSLEAFFASPSDWSKVNENLEAVLDELRAALLEAGYALPQAWSMGNDALFTAPFTPDPESDPFDQLLEAFGAAIAASDYDDYAAFLAAVTEEGAALPRAPEETGQPGNTVAATVHASLVDAYTLTFHVGAGAGCGSACDYEDGQEVAVTVHADNTLSVGGKTLSDPFHFTANGSPLATEIVWRDGDLVYGLSDNSTGAFNEINVGLLTASGGFPTFLGQLRPGSAGDALITQFAGSYEITHQYQGATPDWTGLTIGANGSIVFAGGPSIQANQIATITDRIACCGRVDIAVNVDLDESGAIDNADSVNLYANASGALSAVEIPGFGVRVDAVTLPTHDGTDIPATDSAAATAQVVGGDMTPVQVTINQAPAVAAFNNLTLGGNLTAGEPPVLQQSINIRIESEAPLAAGPTYPCYEDTAQGNTTRLSIKTGATNTQDYNSQYGGRCAITLTTVEVTQGYYSLVEGTFTAELPPFKRNNPPITVNNGVFHWNPGAPQ
jgi:hypothetical protein